MKMKMKAKARPKFLKKEKIFVEPEKIADDLESDDGDADSGHDSLVKSLIKNSKLQTDFKWQSKRTEAKSTIDEFGIRKDEKTRVSLNKLLKASKNAEGKKKLRSFEQKAVTAAPLKTPLAKKAARKANYTSVKDDVKKYDPIVKEMRRADQVIFPLEQDKLKFNVSEALGTSTSKNEKPKPVSSLEKDIEGYIQANSANVEMDSQPFTANELAILNAKSVEEARAIHREIQKRRMLISFQESKYRRMRKIKSKKYHRLLKKEKLKKTVEEFDREIEENPDKALEKLEELDKLRALERASLKHHNTGKWAKHQKLRAKYDENARENMNANLKINSDLMRKRSLALLDLNNDEDDDDEVDDDNDDDDKEEEEIQEQIEAELEKTLGSTVNSYNPWISSEKTAKKRKYAQLPKDDFNPDNRAIDDYLRHEIERRIREEKETERARLRTEDANDDRNIDETDGNEVFEPINLDPNFEQDNDTAKNADKNGEEELGHNFNEFDFHNNEFLKEAFIDDDVVEEFHREQEEQARKEEEERLKRKKKIEVLPGWGDWAGPGIEEDPDKKKKFIQKELKKQKKIDTRIANAIILKDIDSLGAQFKIPRKPTTVCDAKIIERTVAKPIGSTWNPQIITKSLTEPSVIIPRGQIIEPMSSKATDKIDI